MNQNGKSYFQQGTHLRVVQHKLSTTLAPCTKGQGARKHSQLSLNRLGGNGTERRDDMKRINWQRLATIGL